MDYTNRGKIIRKFNGHYENYKLYKDHLADDFLHRCAYCDTRDDIITTPFEIDHFIPRKVFENVKDSLDTDYNNLVYSCKKCNMAKSSKFSGDIKSVHPTNDLFYDPVLTDYNNIFYRNEYGIIVSDDSKAKVMISLLRLYRPIYALSWIIGQTYELLDKLEKRIGLVSNSDELDKLKQVQIKLNNYLVKVNRIFIANYNSKNEFN